MSAKFKGNFVKNTEKRWDESLERVEKCLNFLSEEEIWKSPGVHLNSVGNLVLHLNGNIKQYVISTLGGEKDDRRRSEEFLPESSMNSAELLKEHRNTLKRAKEVLKELHQRDFNTEYLVQGFELTGIGIIIHVTEHYSYHTGQIALLTKQMTGKDLGFYAGLDLDVRNDDGSN